MEHKRILSLLRDCCVWNGENDNSINGEIYELKWWKLQKLNNNKWEEIKAKD